MDYAGPVPDAGCEVLDGVAQVAAQLRELRVMHGLTHAMIGRATGMSAQTVSRVETNDYYSTALIEHLTAYAEAVGYTLRMVLICDDTPTPAGDQ